MEEDAGRGRHPHHADEGRRPRRPTDPGLDRIARAAVRHDLPVNLHCWDNLDDGIALIDRHPDTRFIIDHHRHLAAARAAGAGRAVGEPAEGAGARQAQECRDQDQRRLHAVEEPYPYPDIWDPLGRVFDAWGIDRCLWGTDWTRAAAVVNYEQGVEPFRTTTASARASGPC